MADVLSLSAKTIESHRAAALRKLNLATTADLIRYAVRNNLVDHRSILAQPTPARAWKAAFWLDSTRL